MSIRSADQSSELHLKHIQLSVISFVESNLHHHKKKSISLVILSLCFVKEVLQNLWEEIK